MTTPTIRDEVLLAWRGILTRAGIHPSELEHLVLELEQAAKNRGAPLPNRPRVDDPNAIALNTPPPGLIRPARDSADARAARDALRPYGGVDARTERPGGPIPPMPDDTGEESR